MWNRALGSEAQTFITPLGWAGIAASERDITKVVLPKASREAVERELANAECGMRNAETSDRGVAPRIPSKNRAGNLASRAVKLLQQYFSGKQVLFDLPLGISSYTAFQQAVWRATQQIPFGETRSYAWVAERIGRPGSARAVGQALGANPVPVFIP